MWRPRPIMSSIGDRTALASAGARASADALAVPTVDGFDANMTDMAQPPAMATMIKAVRRRLNFLHGDAIFCMANLLALWPFNYWAGARGEISLRSCGVAADNCSRGATRRTVP